MTDRTSLTCELVLVVLHFMKAFVEPLEKKKKENTNTGNKTRTVSEISSHEQSTSFPPHRGTKRVRSFRPHTWS